MSLLFQGRKMGKPHIIAIPYPAQGHVIPMMEVAQCLANNGVRVTLVNTEFNHERVMKALSQRANIHKLINLVSIPDGLEQFEDRNQQEKLAEGIATVMPGKLKVLVETVNREETGKITCLLADFYMGWALELAEKLGIKRAAFVPSSVASLALSTSIEKLVSDGIIGDNGTPLKEQMVRLSPSMPEISTSDFPWVCFPDLTLQKMGFRLTTESSKTRKLAQKLLCNSSSELEPGELTFVQDSLPIGPLLASTRLGNSAGHFWPEESTCLEWLDRQACKSVIYVAFGSFTLFDIKQLQELALGLELTNRPFLWVVRQDMAQNVHQSFLKDFTERIQSRGGNVVGWAPQQQVLSHPSVACFVSHCGWNSTLEGVSNGVPFLCWPYFCDQFLNQTYIREHWEVGLGLAKDENGIIKREEIVHKVEQLLSDVSYRTRSVQLQEKIVRSVTRGSSHENFHKFIDWIKGN